MYCPHCGKKIPDGSNFCMHCGQEIIYDDYEEEYDQSPVEVQDEPTPVRSPRSKTATKSKSSTKKFFVILIIAFAVIFLGLAAVTYAGSNGKLKKLIGADPSPTPLYVTPYIYGTWRDEELLKENGGIQYEVYIDMLTDTVSIYNIREDGSSVPVIALSPITEYGLDYVIAGGYKFTYNDGLLETNSSMFTKPPLKKYTPPPKTPSPEIPDYSPYTPKSSGSTYSSSSAKFSEDEAFVVAEYIVRENLVSPSTAKFCRLSEAECTYNSSTDRWTVKGWVDSQNYFGAMIRQDFTAVFQPIRKNGQIGCEHGTVTFD